MSDTLRKRSDAKGMVTRLIKQLDPKLDKTGNTAYDNSDQVVELVDKLKRSFINFETCHENHKDTMSEEELE